MDTHDLRQPEFVDDIVETNWNIADDIFIKRTLVRRAGIKLDQHVHPYEHHTMLAVGSAKVFKDGVQFGEFAAPFEFVIPAGVLHQFEVLEPGTIIYCIHNISRTGEVEITAAKPPVQAAWSS